MSRREVQVRELSGWDFDDYSYRPGSYSRIKRVNAQSFIARRPSFQATDPLVNIENPKLQEDILCQASRPDLHAEMEGLNWSFGVVDLRFLVAFQRRLYFDRTLPQIPAPAVDDWRALIDLSFGPPKSVVCDFIRDSGTGTLILQSSNPNLQLCVSENILAPLKVHAGSPFLEVAEFRGRWFLRDGYHRSYLLLQAGVFRIPAVIVHAKTIEEVGAARPWHFPENVLFSPRPPQVADFLDNELNIEYTRPPLIKTLRITMEESLIPASASGEQL